MHRFLILFICWQRRHYDKSTLSMLCETQHQKEFFPEYYSTKQNWLTVFTEKKVKIWHSKLPSNITPSDPLNVITQRAKVISDATHENSFQHHFAPEYQRGTSEKDHTLLAGKAAEFLIHKFQCIAKNLTKIKQVGLYLCKAAEFTLWNVDLASQSLSEVKSPTNLLLLVGQCQAFYTV